MFSGSISESGSTPREPPISGSGGAVHDNAALTASARARRRRLSLLAFLMGLASVALSVTIVVGSLMQNRKAAEQRFLQNTRIEVRMLAQTVDLDSRESPAPAAKPAFEGAQDPQDARLLKTMSDYWGNSPHFETDEHFVIIDNVDSEVIFDTFFPGPSHRPPPQPNAVENDELRATQELIVNVREKMGLPAEAAYSGEFHSAAGEPLIGSFRNVSEVGRKAGRNWLLGIYRSKARLSASAFHFGDFGTLILVCGLAMPLSLLLMYYTYQLAQRDQARVEEARTRLAAIVQSSEDAIYSESFGGRITSWNRGAEHVFGFSEAEAIGRSSAELIPSERPAEESQIVAQLIEGASLAERSFETIRLRKDGKPIHVSQSVSPIEDARGRPVGVSIIARDITARKNLEREVLEITSTEQQRIGRELHDSLGQVLTGLSFLAKSLSQKLAAAGNPEAETAQTITTGIQQAVGEVRRAVRGLVPVEVDASGFMVALEKLAADTRSRCNVNCRVECVQPVPIDDNLVATHLYRIVQEAINNAVKHAQARQIVVRPEARMGTLSVTVEDDGVGIGDNAARNGGLGLRIMQYRAGAIDATLDVRTSNGRGTAVVCVVKTKAAATSGEAVP